MMYVYRIDKIHPEALKYVHPSFSSKVYQTMVDELCRLARKQLGWDGTIAERYIIPLMFPGERKYAVCFQAATTGAYYVGSPYELPYLHDHLDYDARTDSEEVERAVRAVKEFAGETFVQVDAKPEFNIKTWWRSTKGNLTTRIRNTAVVVTKVIQTNDNLHSKVDYVGCILGLNDRKLFTPE